MKNVDRWFILIGLLYGTFGVGFGIWMGIHGLFDLAPIHAHINLVGFAAMVLFGLIYRSFPALAASRLAAWHFTIYMLGAILFVAGLPLAMAHQTIAVAVIGSLMVLVGFFVFLVNFLVNGFSAKARA
jgi:cbb3-type cytochrome oxidase subunit 1